MKLNDTTRWKIIWLDPFNRSLGRPTAAHRWRLSGRWNEYCMLAPFLCCRFSCCSADFSFQCYYVDGSLWIDLSILCYISGFYFLIELHGVWEDNDRPRNEDLCYLSVDICFADYWCWCKRTISFGVTTQHRWNTWNLTAGWRVFVWSDRVCLKMAFISELLVLHLPLKENRCHSGTLR